MLPIICRIGPFSIYSYGLMFAIAAVVVAVFMGRDAKQYGIKPQFIHDLVFWGVFCGILGARLLFVLLNLDIFMDNPKEIFMIQRGGLAFQGGLVVGVTACMVFTKRNGLSLLKVLDLMGPYIALGQAIGRIGCFLNGCCYGHPVSWGIYFPVHDAHLHPTQLYATVVLLIIFFILKKSRSILKSTGQVFALYLMLSAAQRFGNEFFRGDHFTTYAGLSFYQLVSLGIFGAGIVMFMVVKKAGK